LGNTPRYLEASAKKSSIRPVKNCRLLQTFADFCRLLQTFADFVGFMLRKWPFFGDTPRYLEGLSPRKNGPRFSNFRPKYFPVFEIYFPIFSFSTFCKIFHFSIFRPKYFPIWKYSLSFRRCSKNPDRIREFFEKGERFCRMHFGGIFWHLLNRLKIGHTIHARKALRQFGQRIFKTGKTSPRFQSNPAQRWAHSPRRHFFGRLDQEGKSTCFLLPILPSEFSSFGNAHFRLAERFRVSYFAVMSTPELALACAAANVSRRDVETISGKIGPVVDLVASSATSGTEVTVSQAVLVSGVTCEVQQRLGRRSENKGLLFRLPRAQAETESEDQRTADGNASACWMLQVHDLPTSHTPPPVASGARCCHRYHRDSRLHGRSRCSSRKYVRSGE